MDLISFSTTSFLTYVLILFRVSGIMIFAPVFGSGMLPAQVKIAASMVIALALLPVTATPLPQTLSTAFMLQAALAETIVGLIIGYAASLVFIACQLGGMQIGQQMGTEIGSVFNPFLETQSSLVGEFYFIFATFIYLGIGGHRMFLAALVDSFDTMPLGTMALGGRTLDMVITLFGQLFIVAFAISAPAVLALFLVTVAMGFVARTVPQMNILVVGFPVRVIIGLIVMMVSLPAVGYFLAKTMGAVSSSLALLVAGK